VLSCRVHFYRNVLGLPFSVPRGRVEIRRARDETRAIEAAKRRFARRQGVADWSLIADHFDVVCPGHEQPHQATTQAPLRVK
jgi:hypothetical protein